MGLSNELIESFVKIANDNSDKKKAETTVMGTVVKYNDKDYVKLDGSELLTPVDSTIVSQNGDRVMVLIKDHTATITGSTSSPSASNKDLNDTKTEIGSKISEFEIVIADKVSTKEFDAEKGRIDDLLAENVRIKEKLTATEADIGELTADNVTINEQLTAANASIENLSTKKLDAEVADLTYATIDNLNATNASVNNLTSNYGEFKELATNKFTANEAAIDNLETNKLSAEEADIRYATIGSLNATDAKVNTLEGNFGSFKTLATDKLSANEAAINDLEAKKLSATDADIKYANIDFTNIDIAAISTLFTESGIIKDLVVSGGNITGELVGVTIKGDLIEAGTVKADKLVVKGSDGLFYKLNIEGGATTSTEITEEDLKNGLSGRLIVAKSITAEKIAVDDLVAFGATIGGFHITSNSLYSGAKTSATNTTRGVFFGNDGQFAVGDSNNYVKFFKGTDGNYKLYIAAEDLIFGSSGKSVEDALNDTKTEINNNVNKTISGLKTEVSSEVSGMINDIQIGGRNLLIKSQSVADSIYNENGEIEPYEYETSAAMLSYIAVTPGDKYTLSRKKGEAGYYRIVMYDTNKTFKSYKSLHRELPFDDDGYYIWAVPNDVYFIKVSYPSGDNAYAKFEKGNMRTDWTPAPEDVDAYVDSFKDSVDNIKIGGRNLIIKSQSKPHSEFDGENIEDTSNQGEGSENSWVMESYIPVTPGEELTFSRKAGLGHWFYVVWYDSSKTYISSKKIPIDWGAEGICIWAVPDRANYIRVSYPGDDASKAKLERGNKPTDYTPAPEDVDANMSSTVNTTVNSAMSGVKEEINNKVNTQLSDAKVEINNSVNTQINNAKTEINTSINNTKSELNTNINNTKNELVGKIEGIEIGGRNLIASKNVVTGWVNSTGAIISDKTYRASGYISVSPGDTITFQLWTPNSVRSWIDDTYFDSNKQYVTGYNGEYVTSDHIVKKYIVPEGVSYVRMSYSWVTGCKAKLERGNKPTDYTPAPEDVDPDNVQVGGRNLIIRSMSREKAYYAGSSYTSTESLSDSGLINSWAMESYISVSPGEELTFSRKAGLGSYFYVSWYTKDKSYLGNAQISGIGNKSSGHYTWKVPDNANYIRVSYPGDLGSESKLERGNRATDWSQAPEDIDTTISSTLESITSMMAEQNTSLIKNSEAIMLEALKSYTEVGDFEALKKSIESQLKLLSDRMTLNFSQTTERLEYTNNELQSQISTMTKYFTFNIDGLTIGSNESPYSVIIDNDRYSMKYFNKEIFYVANGKLYTPDLEVSGIFNLKDYLIDYDGSDNLNMTYKRL